MKIHIAALITFAMEANTLSYLFLILLLMVLTSSFSSQLEALYFKIHKFSIFPESFIKINSTNSSLSLFEH